MHGRIASVGRVDNAVTTSRRVRHYEIDEALIEAVVARLRTEFPLASMRPPAPVGGAVKRLMDICVAAIALMLLGPLLIVIAVFIKAQDGGRVLYSHRRVGFRGRMFRCWKFRTMAEDADQRLAFYLGAHPAAAKEWERTQKLVEDPRVTPIGRILRKLSFDELPQLYNVLVGDMSLVGPRPVLRSELERFGRSRRHYMRARPGLSGAWQVSGRNNTTYTRRVSLDRHYVANWSIWTDIGILLRTIPVMLDPKGAY